MNNQHKLIKGYRDLNEAEIESMNEIKEHAASCERMIESLLDDDDTDKRWARIGITLLQQGFMALVRSVAKPDSF